MDALLKEEVVEAVRLPDFNGRVPEWTWCTSSSYDTQQAAAAQPVVVGATASLFLQMQKKKMDEHSEEKSSNKLSLLLFLGNCSAKRRSGLKDRNDRLAAACSRMTECKRNGRRSLRVYMA